MGKLAKPQQWQLVTTKPALYSDAPELLEQAWQSVEQHHQQFLTFWQQRSDTTWIPAQQKDY